MNLFDTALSVDLATVIGNYSGVQIDSARNHNTVCPICDHGHNTGCFGLYGKRKGQLDRFKCFSCGAHGDSIDFVMTMKHLASRADAAKDICDSFGLAYDTPKMPNGLKEYAEAMSFVANLFHLSLPSAKDPDYFRARGISQETIDSYLLGYCPEFFTDKSGRVVSFRSILRAKGYEDSLIDSLGVLSKTDDCLFAGRYVFPIRDQYGNVVAFAGRSIDLSQPKYINSPETTFFRKSWALFNYDKAKAFSTVYVVEGYMDALSLITIGVPNVVAAMGTAFGSNHMSMLKGKNIILALDNDEAGRNHIASIIESFRDCHFRVMRPFPSKDLNDALANGEPLFEYLDDLDTGVEFYIHHVARSLDLSTLEGRSTLYFKVAALIGGDSPRWQDRFPLNVSYTPFDLDYFWKRCVRYVRKHKEAK